uniref:p494 protein n=1 Tax=Glyptapanteles indiensis TaxID=92994 RepID=A0JCV0_GLYIN|nr:P494 protein [Glyptapanteles indiensis]
MRGAAVCVLLCIGTVVSNSRATENGEYGDGMTVKEEVGKRVIVLQGSKNDVTIAEQTNEDGSRSMIYEKETRGKLGDTRTTESRKDEGGMTVKDEPGKRLIITRGGKYKYEESITDKNYDDGLRSTIFKRETRRKLENKTNLIVVTEEVFKNEIYPKGFKVIRTVVTGSVDDKDPRKNALLSDQSETYPDFESWRPMFPDNRPVKKTNNQQENVPQPTGEILATPPPQHDPESGRNHQGSSIVNERPPFGTHNGEKVSAQTVGGRTGGYPPQYGPGLGHNPQDPSEVNERPPLAAHNGEKVSAQTVGGMARGYPSQYGPGSGYNPQDPSIVNQYPTVAAQNGGKVSAQTFNGMAGAYPSQYEPRSGHNFQDPAIVNERPPFAADYSKRVSPQTVDGRTGAYPTQYGPGSGNYFQEPSVVNEHPPSTAHNSERLSAQTVGKRTGGYPPQYGPGLGHNPQDPSVVNERPPSTADYGQVYVGPVFRQSPPFSGTLN